jgi:23S rRNA pseudouridine1911/1915/1917 synthase
VALTERAHHPLAAHFADHTIERTYYALAWNPPEADSGSFQTGYGRHPNHRIKFTSQGRHKKKAVTHWEIIERFDQCALFKLKLETGRTHQIRVHMSEAGMPLMSDALYGIKRRIDHHHPLKLLGWELGFKRQALHAQSLGFTHPITQETLTFTSPLPADFDRALSTLRSVYSYPI